MNVQSRNKFGCMDYTVKFCNDLICLDFKPLVVQTPGKNWINLSGRLK